MIEWQNTIGGNSSEQLYSVKQTIDGGYILGGWSDSGFSGDKTEVSNGEVDFWVVKLDSTGAIQWQNSIGGNTADYLYVVEEIGDGYILGGVSYSDSSGDKSENSMSWSDYWVVKIDSTGIIEWENTIGGDDRDEFTSIKPTSDGGYIMGGYSNSGISGDKSEEAWIGGDMGYDYWVVKIDSLGNVEWDNTIGGFGDDYLMSVDVTIDGGYILGGFSSSNASGDKTEDIVGMTSFSDYWVIKLDSAGDIIWQNTIGGDYIEVLSSVIQTADGGYILAGYSNSEALGDKTESNIGFEDYWLVKLDSAGNIVWQNTIGGLGDDYPHLIQQTTEGGYILAGNSNSGSSPDKSEDNIGAQDYWVVKLSSIGTIEWENTIGGVANDFLYEVDQTDDGGFILGGYSFSGISGDKSELNMGFSDYWVVKLYPEDCILSTYYADTDNDGYGNSFSSVVACLPPLGYVADDTDCDDANFFITPDALEVCNGADDDCNGLIDDGFILFTFYADEDGDGYGNIFMSIDTCSVLPPAGYVTDSTDCDDANSLIHEPVFYYADADEDLYGSDDSISFCTGVPPSGFVANNLDCDDADFFVNPGSNEICNALDDDCNSEIDEGMPDIVLFVDTDDDGYGNPLFDTVTCFTEISGYVLNNLDCDDTDPNIYFGAPEVLNGLDDNCNNEVDEGFTSIESIIEQPFVIYPNPNNGTFQIKFQDISPQHINIAVFNSTGSKIYEMAGSKGEFEIRLPSFFSGVANIMISSKDYSISESIYIINKCNLGK